MKIKPFLLSMALIMFFSACGYVIKDERELEAQEQRYTKVSESNERKTVTIAILSASTIVAVFIGIAMGSKAKKDSRRNKNDT